MVTTYKFGNISGIVADIGLSSFQLEGSGRGISFQKQEPLDMRFDLSDNSTDAKFIVNNWDQSRLTEIFQNYGEEKFSSPIARKIVQHRQLKLLHYTTDLVAIIQEALPAPEKHRFADSARRIFQALRITVNHELENLETFLPKAFDLLAKGGKLAIISFHSLEDRIVKEYFLSLARGCICPLDFPQCICGQTPKAKILTKKPITAKPYELEKNPRSKPAKLRVVEKL
jgi:16S rRNA (cytosine1402-N4)-methyltransferase